MLDSEVKAVTRFDFLVRFFTHVLNTIEPHVDAYAQAHPTQIALLIALMITALVVSGVLLAACWPSKCKTQPYSPSLPSWGTVPHPIVKIYTTASPRPTPEEIDDIQDAQKAIDEAPPEIHAVPTFEIAANPMIPITQIKERRFEDAPPLQAEGSGLEAELEADDELDAAINESITAIEKELDSQILSGSHMVVKKKKHKTAKKGKKKAKKRKTR